MHRVFQSTCAKSIVLGVMAASVPVLLSLTTVAHAGDSGIDLAEKFAKSAEQAAAKERSKAAEALRQTARDRAAAEQAKTEEQDMLLRARREAEDQKRADALAAKSGVQTPAVSDPLDAEQQRKAELDRVAAKLKMARDARDAKRAIEAKNAVDAAATKSAQVATQVGADAQNKPNSSNIVVAAPAKLIAPPVGDVSWSTEVKTESAPAPDFDTTSRSALGGSGLKLAPDAPTAKLDPITKVTVLMVLAPGDKGIRRFEKTADPVLCTRDGCYISAGMDQDAIQKPIHKTLGPGNTFGRRAGACNHALGCVFRGVEVGASQNYLQPVDLKVMVHDRRRQVPLVADTSCRVIAGSLTCDRPIVEDTYKLWVVPEHVAADIGPAGLSRAIAARLASTVAADAGVTVRR
jgi:hypothetical protein